MHTENRKKNRLLILLLLLLLIIAIAVAVWALYFRPIYVPVLAPDRAPQTEENAQPIPGEVPEVTPANPNSVSLTYSDRATIDLSKETVSLVFANPSRSAQNIVLQVVVQDTVLVQTGTLPAGHQLDTLELLPGMARRLQEGMYEGMFHLYFYDPVSGEKAGVDTQIPIQITVKH